jgi:hypothetical protein
LRNSAFADDLFRAGRLSPARFAEQREKRVRSIEPAAIGAAGNLARADKDRLLQQGKVRNAMAGSPDAVAPRIAEMRDSFSPSCSWLSGLARNHERNAQCSIFTELNSIGVGAS